MSEEIEPIELKLKESKLIYDLARYFNHKCCYNFEEEYPSFNYENLYNKLLKNKKIFNFTGDEYLAIDKMIEIFSDHLKEYGISENGIRDSEDCWEIPVRTSIFISFFTDGLKSSMKVFQSVSQKIYNIVYNGHQ